MVKKTKGLVMIGLVIVAILFLVDLYTFKGIKLLIYKQSDTLKNIIYIAFWIVSIAMLTAIFLGYYFRGNTRSTQMFSIYYYFFGIFLVLYVPKIIFITFHFTEDMLFAGQWLISKSHLSSTATDSAALVSRVRYISQVGIIVASLPFLTFIWGMVKGRFNFKVEQAVISYTTLPKSFDGLTVLQISDLHIGSFKGFERQIEEAVNLINAQQPDIIVFTGDLVNNFHDELNGWIPILKKMKARIGKYSVLGNHDYGSYFKWNTDAEKQENLRKIMEAHAAMGFKLLNNSADVIEINGEKIAIVGVENWGLPPFPQKGDYKMASSQVKDIPFKILLSHDPTHWDAKIAGKTDVALTLAGHTHGMQFGIQVAGFKWSPSKYKFKRWAGLYEEGDQYLYVNTGLGNIGYPGRVGMSPEITVLELKHKESAN
jgi:predicted MPP superfamily phosphohydrolase